MINERKRLKVKFCKGRNARLTLSFQYVNRWFKTLKTALPYTLSGSTEPGGISLEPWGSLFTVSRVTSLNSHLHRMLTLPLPSLSSQTLRVGTLFSVVISRPPRSGIPFGHWSQQQGAVLSPAFLLWRGGAPSFPQVPAGSPPRTSDWTYVEIIHCLLNTWYGPHTVLNPLHSSCL